ncbi:MAG: hypothetical protein RLZZ08_1089 [Pseudomonadota bacterium]|jgi:hypothetical protein
MVRLVSVVALAVLATACDPQAGGSSAATPTPGTTATPPPAPAAPPTPSDVASSDTGNADGGSATAIATSRVNGALSVKEETDDYIFEYAYPSAAGSIDALGDLLDARMEKTRAELARDSAKARAEARGDGFPYNKHSYEGTWTLVANLPGFVSLSEQFATYTGGAHGNYGVESLVWDKQAARAMRAIDLFTSPAALEQALGQRFCTGLDKERRRKGIERPKDGDGVFPACPKIDELTVLVGSTDKRHFNRVTLYAGPYVAGAYAEGDYQVHLDVDRKIRAAVKPAYRDSFRARN